MTDLTEEEHEVTLAALKNFISRYHTFREEVEAEAIRKALSKRLRVAKMAERKLNGSSEGRCLFVYVPNGIYDEGLEKEFRKRVPKHSEHPDRKNVFWSKKYNNFVIRGHKDEAEEAINARYGEKATIDKDPEFATKPNTWQVAMDSPETPNGSD